MVLQPNREQNLPVKTEQSVTKITMACGFQSTSRFSKVYRAHSGTSRVTQRGKIA